MKKPVSVTLSKKSLDELDRIVVASNFETRSRTIEETIIAMSQIISNYRELVLLSEYRNGKRAPSNEDIGTFLNKIQVILERLGADEGLREFLVKKGSGPDGKKEA